MGHVIRAGNMSLGVNLLAALTKKVASLLDDDFDIEIIEMHHKHKVDAPSGTAYMLGHAAAEGRGVPPHEINLSPTVMGKQGHASQVILAFLPSEAGQLSAITPSSLPVMVSALS